MHFEKIIGGMAPLTLTGQPWRCFEELYGALLSTALETPSPVGERSDLQVLYKNIIKLHPLFEDSSALLSQFHNHARCVKAINMLRPVAGAQAALEAIKAVVVTNFCDIIAFPQDVDVDMANFHAVAVSLLTHKVCSTILDKFLAQELSELEVVLHANPHWTCHDGIRRTLRHMAYEHLDGTYSLLENVARTHTATFERLLMDAAFGRPFGGLDLHTLDWCAALTWYQEQPAVVVSTNNQIAIRALLAYLPPMPDPLRLLLHAIAVKQPQPVMQPAVQPVKKDRKRKRQAAEADNKGEDEDDVQVKSDIQEQNEEEEDPEVESIVKHYFPPSRVTRLPCWKFLVKWKGEAVNDEDAGNWLVLSQLDGAMDLVREYLQPMVKRGELSQKTYDHYCAKAKASKK